jgi:hypothetical protein
MALSTIAVYYPDGSPVSHTKVVLGFRSGMSRPGFTDHRGMATVEHASRGKATIYVSGRRCGSFHAPGKTSVTYK